MTTKKILCICDGGNVRSVAMAQYIKEQNKRMWMARPVCLFNRRI